MKLPDPLKHSPIYPDEDRNEQHSRARYVEGWNACLAEVVRLNDTEAPAAVEVSRLAEEVTRLVFNLGDIAWHAGKHGENVGTPYHATHEIFAAKLKALATMASPEVTLNGLTEAETPAPASVQGLSEAGRLASGGEVGFSPMWLAPIDGTPVLLYLPTSGAKFAVGQFWEFTISESFWGDEESVPFTHKPAGWMGLHVLERLATTQASPTSAVERETGEATSQAARDVLAERQRQISAEGWTAEHDDEHADGGMANAAACYALHTEPVGNVGDYLRFWPWASEWWKPKDRRSNLVRAGALVIAEIERIDRRIARGPICSDCGARVGAAHNYGCMYSELDV